MPDAIHIVIVVFGSAYTGLMAKITLANLAALVQEIPQPLRSRSAVRIFTTRADVALIERAPAFAVLGKSIRVEIVEGVTIDGLERYGGYGPMVVTQRRAVLDAAQANAAIFFVGPDQIYSKGAFALFINRLRDGYRVIIGPGLRVKRDAVLPLLLGSLAGDGALVLDPEKQIDTLFTYWHPINDQFVMGSEQDIAHKAYIYYRPHPDELLMRFFQGPTFVAWPKAPLAGFDGFIDHNLILYCCSNEEEAYVVSDGRECLALDLTEDTRVDRQALADVPEVALLRELFDREAIKDIQLLCALRNCRVGRGSPNRDYGAFEREFSGALDPLIRIAIFERRLAQRRGGAWSRMRRLLILANTNLVSRAVRLVGHSDRRT